MHFFTELDKIDQQDAMVVARYGYVVTDAFNKYETGANFKTNAVSRVFAAQDAMMIVQPNTLDNNLVNLILRPIKGLEISSETVQYYVYRGVSKADFLTGTDIVTPGTIKTITEFRANWAAYVADTGYGGPEPTPAAVFGYNEPVNLANDILIENIFNNTTADTRAIKVSEGEWIGNFPAETIINFEIIINSEYQQAIDPDHTDYLRFDLGYFRKNKNIIDVTNVDPSNLLSANQKAYKLKIRREEVLSFIDPAAFYGTHYYQGVSETYFDSGSSTYKTRKLKKQNIVDDVLTKFITKNRVYIDIRSEYGYSLNFYGNYQTGTFGEVLQVRGENALGFTHNPYSTFGWPIFFDQNWVGTKPMNRVELKLRIGDENKSPLGYLDYPRFRGMFNKKKFFVWDGIPDSPYPDYFGVINLKFPNDNILGPNKVNVSQYIRLQYFRLKDYDGAFPDNVLNPQGSVLNRAFGGLHMASIDGLANVFNHKKSQRLQLVRGSDFFYTSYPESYIDNATGVLFVTEMDYSGKKGKDRRPKKQFVGNTITESLVFPQEIAFQKVKIREDNGSGTYIDRFVLQLTQYVSKRKKSKGVEEFFLLALTTTQYNNLVTDADNANLSSRHPILIQFTANPHLQEENGIEYQRYNLSLLGLDDTGKVKVVTPTTPISVYSFDDYVLASHEYASTTVIPQGYPDPALIKQWDHVGTWHYRYLNGIDYTIQDEGGTSGLSTPFKVNLNANVFYPTDYEGVTDPDEISSVKSSYPLIVIVHGNGQFYKQYDLVSSHLAKNGFIVASIDCTLIDVTEVSLLSITGYTPYDYMFNSIYSRDVYGYDSTNKAICLLNKTTQSFPAINKLSYTSPGDFEEVIVSGLLKGLKFKKSMKAFGGRYGMAALGRSNVLFLHLEALKNKFSTNIQNNIGLIGHSRGGEAVVAAERYISSQTIANLSGIDQIKAIFSLAPTDQYALERLSGVPYFLLYGSRDGDVSTAGASLRKDPYNFNAEAFHTSGN
jgi:hypothetical protein